MLSSRRVAFASMCLIGITLGGCQYLQKLKKSADDADGGADAEALTETPVTEAPGATDDAGARPLAAAAEPAATAAATASTTKPAVATKADAGAADGGAGVAVRVDAGAGVAVRVDAGAVSAADAGAPAARTVVDAGAAAAPSKNCCCDVAGKKDLVERNECTTTLKGQCVRMTSCATIIRR